MLQRYKEIFYGLLFGLGTSVIDVFMHASMEQQGFWTELFRPQLAMVAYRASFIAFGLALGWLLWRRNRVERDFRSLLENVEQFRRGIGAPQRFLFIPNFSSCSLETISLSRRSTGAGPVRLRKVAGDSCLGPAEDPADKSGVSMQSVFYLLNNGGSNAEILDTADVTSRHFRRQRCC
jgi:hypothetical protein